jgi:hypothetical protein
MAIEKAYKLIDEMNDRAEAVELDRMFEDILKDPEMRADMERAAGKWEALMNDEGTIAPAPSQPEMER